MAVTETEAAGLICCRMVKDSNTVSGLMHCVGSKCMAWSVVDDGYERETIANDDEARMKSKGWEREDHPRYAAKVMRRKVSDAKAVCGLADHEVYVENQL